RAPGGVVAAAVPIAVNACSTSPAARRPQLLAISHHVRDHWWPGLGGKRIEPCRDSGEQGVEPRERVVVRDVLRDEHVAATDGFRETLVEHREPLFRVAGVEQREREPRGRPDALEVRACRARDRYSLATGLDGGSVLELELVHAGQPQVCEGEIGGRTVTFELEQRLFECRSRLDRAALF